MRKVFVTGAAGFIGFHVAKALLEQGESVVGLDNINDYYDRQLKRDRLKQLVTYSDFSFIESDLEDKKLLKVFFAIIVLKWLSI